jgi:hypothetical protein
LLAVVLASGSLFKNGKLIVTPGSVLGLLNVDNLPGLLAIVTAVVILVVVFALIYLVLQQHFPKTPRVATSEGY